MKTYMIRTRKSITRGCRDRLVEDERILQGTFKDVYKHYYKWMRSQYCAVVTIYDENREVCTMMIGELGDLLLHRNHKILTVRGKQLKGVWEA